MLIIWVVGSNKYAFAAAMFLHLSVYVMYQVYLVTDEAIKCTTAIVM